MSVMTFPRIRLTARHKRAPSPRCADGLSGGPRPGRRGDDYTARNGTVTFSSGENQKKVGVESLTDTVSEDDETFKLKLGNRTTFGTAFDCDRPGLGQNSCEEQMVVATGGFPATMTLTGKIADVAPRSGN